VYRRIQLEQLLSIHPTLIFDHFNINEISDLKVASASLSGKSLIFGGFNSQQVLLHALTLQANQPFHLKAQSAPHLTIIFPTNFKYRRYL
jgi:hypothetical protein